MQILSLIKKIIQIPKTLALILIRFYQRFLSLDQSFWGRRLGFHVCIHDPSCSEYTYQSIQKFGLIRGVVMGFFRILRCNPWSKGGYDPVPNSFSIKRFDIKE